MYQTFNMGMGMAIIVPSDSVHESMGILKRHTKSEVKLIGEIKKGKGVELTSKNLIF
jgi:phosphoribosylformylglycinamidine cyclo-ligase